MTYSKVKLLAAYMGAIASMGTDDSIYTLPRHSTRSYYKSGEELAKAKGLSLYTFGVNQYGKTNEVYAKNEKEAIKRAKKRGYNINLIEELKKK